MLSFSSPSSQKQAMMLSATDKDELEQHRNWICDHFRPGEEFRYDNPQQVLELLQVILDQKWVSIEDNVKLNCMGVSFGDALAMTLDLTWIVVNDEYGRDYALQDKNTGLLAFPVTMIMKRVQKSESFTVAELFHSIEESFLEKRRSSIPKAIIKNRQTEL